MMDLGVTAGFSDSARKSFMPGLEYNHEGVTYQYISALDENQANTGIVFVIRPEPDLRIIYYTCLDL